MGNGFRRFVKGKRELEEKRTEFACFVENVEAGTDVALVVGAS